MLVLAQFMYCTPAFSCSIALSLSPVLTDSSPDRVSADRQLIKSIGSRFKQLLRTKFCKKPIYLGEAVRFFGQKIYKTVHFYDVGS